MNFKDSYCANILAFDEVITKESYYDSGNTVITAIREIKELIKFLIKEKCFNDNIKECHLNEYLSICEKTHLILDFNEKKNEDYFLVGWEKHGIFIFYKKNSDDSYDLGMINAGEGAELQGVFGDLCNGIIIFHSITKERLKKFLDRYRKFYESGVQTFEINNTYYRFYFILFNSLFDTDEVNFDNLSETVCTKLKINSQILGTCSFTNHIGYIIYILYRNNVDDYNNKYNEWYHKAKQLMVKKIYEEIYCLDNIFPYISSFLYIKEIYKLEGKNININELDLKKNIKPKNVIHDKSTFITRQKIYDGEYSSIFWNLYDFNDKAFKEIISENQSNQQILKEIIFKLINFDEINDLYNRPYFLTLFELYKLKINNIFLSKDLLKEIWKKIRGPINSLVEIDKDKLLILLIIFTLFQNKNWLKPYYSEKEKMEKNKKIYLYYFLQFIPILNGYYKDIIKVIVNEILENINYFPDIGDNYHSEAYINSGICFITPENASADGFFFIMMKYKKLKKEALQLINNEENEDYKDFGIYVFSDFLNIDITNKLEEKGSHLKFMDYGYYYDNSNLSDKYIYFKDKKVDPEESLELKLKLENYKSNYSVINYIKLFKNKIECNLKQKFNITYYFLYFYLCELDNKLIERSIKKSYENKVSEFIKNNIKNNILYPILKAYLIRNGIIITNQNFTLKKGTYYFSNNEKKYFNLRTLNYTIVNSCCKGIVDFYLVEYNDLKIVFYKNDCNTTRLSLINEIIYEGYNIYTVLNFTKLKEHTFNCLTDQNNDSIKFIELSTGVKKLMLTKNVDGKFPSYYIINENDAEFKTLMSTKILFSNFLHLISMNDKCYLLYYDVKEEGKKNYFYLQLYHYDLFFELDIDNDKIYCTINSIRYAVEFNNDELILNLGIIKLISNGKKKLLCFYNYSLINEDTSYYQNKEFCVISPKDHIQNTDNKNRILDELDDDYQKYFYTIIDNFENKYILKTVEDALAILLNCLYYCSPWLIFITYKSLSEIIGNNKVNKYFIKLLLCNMTGPYASIINLLFINIDLYTEKKFNNKSDYFPEIYSTISNDFNENLEKYNNYNLNYYKKILEKYDIYLNINATSNYINNISIEYNHKWAKQIYIDSNNTISDNPENESEYENEYSCFKCEVNDDKIEYCWWTQDAKDDEDGHCPPCDEEDSKIGGAGEFDDDDYDPDEWAQGYYNPVMKIKIIIKEKAETTFIEESINKKDIKSLKINFNEKKTTIKNFCDLIENNIPNLNRENLQNNICKATELFEYLIKENKTYLFPIQELIMGSGKSSIITPYICILIINYLIQNKLRDREIYIVMPEQLIKQSFETFLKNLFPLHENIDLLIYPNDRIYSFKYNSLIKIYLISDTDYKAMFLDKEKIINTENMYMIYDEVDQMANPLTCELNFPENKVNLKNINIILDITKQLYNKIFLNQQFWDNIKSYVKINNNNKHNYIISEIDQKCLKFINDFFDKNIIIDSIYHNLIDYFKKNILNFILTKQFNYDYGLPEKYVTQVELNKIYKFKGIPYGGGDDPLIGSEFSDVILSYVLTYFCYKLKKPVFREIDIEKMIDKLISKYDKKDEEADKIKIFNIIKNFFNDDLNIIDIYQFKQNINDYYKFIKNINNLISDKFYEKYIEEVLNYNNNYYQNCINISFNDLLLNKNVKNFISFTGTAYINPPVEEKFYYKNNQIINYSKINQYNNVEQAIQYLILNEKKIKNLIMNNDDNIIENIFKCLSKYSVLIDIGAIFINYTNDQFRIKFQENMGNKKYLVYFDNETKIYNLLLNKFENKNIINKYSNDAFFYFSNRYITGVDAKDIMYPLAHGLVTITNHTILRDFSQGIFRMRNILDGDQTIDLIINKNMINDTNILKGGTICDNFTVSNLTRKNLYSNLKENQNLLDIQKNNFLIKQNIFGLVKKDLKNFNLILFNDPSNDTNFSIYDDKKRLYSINDDLTINDINILNYVNDDTSNFIKCLTKKYFSSEINIISTARNIVIQEEKVEGKEKNTEEEDAKTKQKLEQRERERERDKSRQIFDDVKRISNIIIKPNLEFTYQRQQKGYQINTDGIIFLNDKLEFIIYNHNNNIICILNRIQLDLFIGHNTYSNIIDNYTLICYQNDQYKLYWKSINEEELIKIIIIVKKILLIVSESISDISNLVFSKKEKTYMANHNIIEIIKCKYKNIITKYNLITIKKLEDSFQKKYLKYKQKYLQLKNIY